MVPSTIYNDFRNCEQSTPSTITLIQRLLNERLNSNWRRVRVEYCNTGGVMKFCFTLFRNDVGSSYTLRFATIRGFRNWRPESEKVNFNDEVVNIENMIAQFNLHDFLI